LFWVINTPDLIDLIENREKNWGQSLNSELEERKIKAKGERIKDKGMRLIITNFGFLILN
jgi:hypothetical protein